MIGTSVALVSLLFIIYAIHIPVIVVGIALFIFGMGMGSYMSCFSLAKELNPIGFAGTIVALINTGDALFGSFTEPLVGKLLDIGWDGKIVNGIHYFSAHNYQAALSLLPVYLVIALGCLVILGRMK